MGLLFSIGQILFFEKTGFRQKLKFEKEKLFFVQKKTFFSVFGTFTFSNACVIQINQDPN